MIGTCEIRERTERDPGCKWKAVRKCETLVMNLLVQTLAATFT
jgi:hypothetical protein